MSKENHKASAPVHQLVGQLRELLAKVHEAPLLYDTCVIASEAWRGQNGMIRYEAYGGPLADGDPRTLRLCVAAVNALPHLLAIAEAAEMVLVNDIAHKPEYGPDLTDLTAAVAAWNQST